MMVTTCPKCGRPASGRFCSNCAASLSSAACTSCHAPLSAGARFCHLCGTPTAAKAAPSTSLLPWIAGVVTTSLVFAALGFFAGRVNAPDPTPAAGGPGGPFAGTQAGGALPDLSTMTPREQADRLFDRLMREHTAGNTDQVTFFSPMALQAYEMIGPLDADARYHVGLIHSLASGGGDAALAQADSLEQEIPGHLFAFMLRAGVFQVTGEADAVRRNYAGFLDNHDRELAAARPEYDIHSPAVATFLAEARAATRSPN